MNFLRKFGIGICLGLFFNSVVLGRFDIESFRIENIKTGFLSYAYLERVEPFIIETPPKRKVDLVNWEKLKAISNSSIDSCSNPDISSASWKFLQNHKRKETRIILVAAENGSYPCWYIANHLRKNNFNMASLEDIPLAISQKFSSKYLVFFREATFYKNWFHDPNHTINYLKHEEMHIIQSLHNAKLERYMWNQEKTELTRFGRFIEGCTEFHFNTNGPAYNEYVEEYEALLEKALQSNKKYRIDEACGGNYDAYLELKAFL